MFINWSAGTADPGAGAVPAGSPHLCDHLDRDPPPFREAGDLHRRPCGVRAPGRTRRNAEQKANKKRQVSGIIPEHILVTAPTTKVVGFLPV